MLTVIAKIKLIRRFECMAPAKWQAAYEALTLDERMALSDKAAAHATHHTRLCAYVSRRMSGGKHADAVKAQNTAARKVRQALGYTYTDDAITF